MGSFSYCNALKLWSHSRLSQHICFIILCDAKILKKALTNYNYNTVPPDQDQDELNSYTLTELIGGPPPPLSSQLSGGPKLAQNGTASSSCNFPLPPTQTAETRPFLLLLLRSENKASTCSHITISVNKVTSLNDQWTVSKSFLGPSTHWV